MECTEHAYEQHNFYDFKPNFTYIDFYSIVYKFTRTKSMQFTNWANTYIISSAADFDNVLMMIALYLSGITQLRLLDRRQI